jgi:hypothetical protein
MVNASSRLLAYDSPRTVLRRRAVTPSGTALGSPGVDEDLALASLLQMGVLTSIVHFVIGGLTMPEFIVAIDHITYYAVQAEDEITAIDLVLDGQGEEVTSDTRDAYIHSDIPLPPIGG